MAVIDYGFTKTVKGNLEDVKKQDIIDVRATIKQLDVDLNPYVIPGACNPPFAHQALQRLI
ncbi:MAG: DUF302 domain-containing protein [Deltaproteobacteria bacterium]|nr:DUF302 domain-containing protein [Deltaproteobacteria bacterium]